MNVLKKTTDRSLKIYIVDDEEYYVKLVKVNLEKLGYTDIKTFSTGEECLIGIINEKPDVVILDYLIDNHLNGDKILNKIKKNYEDIEVIILSGQEDVNIATDIIRQGATDYIVKNSMSFFNIGNILKKINQIIISDEENKYKIRRIKLLYIILIISSWIIGGVILFIKIKNGNIF